MGNDGGSIPTRRELVKEAARDPNTTAVKETQQEQQEWNWKNCPLSHRPLQRPVVSDAAGRLYNKDAVLEFLLPADDPSSKTDAAEVLQGRVRSLKDVVEVKFEVEQEDLPETKAAAARKGERWVCPITRKALGPAVKAVYLVPCGHAYSESAIKEIASESCVQCDQSYKSDNVIPILAVSELDQTLLTDRATSLREQGLTHSLKKASGPGKKRKKHEEKPSRDGIASEKIASLDDGTGSSDLAATTARSGISASKAGIKNAATASLTAKVLMDEDERKKRQRLGMNDNLKSLFSKGGPKESRNGDFMNRGYTIPAGAKR